jgi:hypothetical protein
MPEQSSSPDIATWPYFEYVKAGSELIDFHLFIFKGINATDSIYIETLRDTWGKVQEGLLPRNAADEILEQPTSYSEFQLYSNCLVQMVLCRYVDSFISYLTELLALTFKTRPEMLKSRQNFTAEFIVEHLASDDLIQAMVEQRVMELSYKGLAELCEYTDEKLGFPLFLTEDHGKRAIRAVDLRNVALRQNPTRSAFQAAFLKATNSVLVAASRCALSNR